MDTQITLSLTIRNSVFNKQIWLEPLLRKTVPISIEKISKWIIN